MVLLDCNSAEPKLVTKYPVPREGGLQSCSHSGCAAPKLSRWLNPLVPSRRLHQSTCARVAPAIFPLFASEESLFSQLINHLSWPRSAESKILGDLVDSVWWLTITVCGGTKSFDSATVILMDASWETLSRNQSWAAIAGFRSCKSFGAWGWGLQSSRIVSLIIRCSHSLEIKWLDSKMLSDEVFAQLRQCKDSVLAVACHLGQVTPLSDSLTMTRMSIGCIEAERRGLLGGSAYVTKICWWIVLRETMDGLFLLIRTPWEGRSAGLGNCKKIYARMLYHLVPIYEENPAQHHGCGSDAARVGTRCAGGFFPSGFGARGRLCE